MQMGKLIFCSPNQKICRSYLENCLHSFNFGRWTNHKCLIITIALGQWNVEWCVCVCNSSGSQQIKSSIAWNICRYNLGYYVLCPESYAGRKIASLKIHSKLGLFQILGKHYFYSKLSFLWTFSGGSNIILNLIVTFFQFQFHLLELS